VEVVKVGRWFALVLLVGFLVFDLCGTKPAKPLPPAAEVERAAAAAQGGDTVSFDQLAGFPAPWPDPEKPFVAPSVPADVKALDGKRVTIAGYIVPLEMKGEKASRLLLCRYAKGCCFGGVPQSNELIDVEPQEADGVKPETHVPTIFTGTLRVRTPANLEELSAGLYRLEDAQVVSP
jgi:hypothetical protein